MNIEIHNISKTYSRGSKKALDQVNLKIGSGVFGLIGRNGAGKTTLMRILATILEADNGDISFDGKDLINNKKEFRSLLGYLPQNTKLMPQLNIVEFLDYVCVMKGIEKKSERNDRIRQIIETVGLVGEEKKRLCKYSGGMLRRAGIAQAIIGDPKVLIIDEPTTGLDPEERLYFLNMLSQISSDKTIIFSTHITADIEHLCKNICILEQGIVKYAGDKLSFINSIDKRIWEFTGTINDFEEVRKKGIVTSSTYIEGNYLVRYVSDCCLNEHSKPCCPTLEDAYIYSIGGIKR